MSLLGGVNAGTLFVNVRPTLTGFARALDAGIHKSTARLQSLDQVGQRMTRTLTAGFLGAAGAGVKLALDVEKNLRSVNSLFGLTGKAAEENFQKMRDQVRGLSDELGVAQDTLSQGLYQAISAGVPERNALTFMSTAARAAIAGMTTTDVAVEGLSKTINAFGLDFADAEKVADSMFTTVNKGIVTFEEMSSFMYQVAPAAAAAGLSLEETNAALTALTLQGVPMAVAATRVQSFLTATARKAEDLDPIFRDLGDGSVQLALKTKGLAYVMRALQKETGGSQKELLKLLGRQEGVQAVNILAGKAADEFTAAIKDQTNAAGVAGKAFKELEKSGARKLERAMTDVKNALIDVGNALLPIVADVVAKIGEWARAFAGLDERTRRAILTIGGLAAAMGPLLTMISRVGLAIRGLRNPLILAFGMVASLIAKWISLRGESEATRLSLQREADVTRDLKAARDELAELPGNIRQQALNVRSSRRSLQDAREHLQSLKDEGASKRDLAEATDLVAQSEINLNAAVREYRRLKRREKRLPGHIDAKEQAKALASHNRQVNQAADKLNDRYNDMGVNWRRSLRGIFGDLSWADLEGEFVGNLRKAIEEGDLTLRDLELALESPRINPEAKDAIREAFGRYMAGQSEGRFGTLRLEGQDVQVPITVNPERFTQQYERVRDQLKGLDKLTGKPKADLDTVLYELARRGVTGSLRALARLRGVPVADLDIEPFRRKLGLVRGALAGLRASVAAPTVNLNTTGTDKRIHVGGVVPGSFQVERPYLLRGGERVLTHMQQRSSRYGGGAQRIYGRLELRNGEAYIYGVAAEAGEDRAALEGAHGRMRR